MRRWLFSCKLLAGRVMVAGMLLEGVATSPTAVPAKPRRAAPGCTPRPARKLRRPWQPGSRRPPVTTNSPLMELYPLLKLSKCGAARQIDLAVDPRDRLSKTLAAMQAGKIDLIRGRIISEGTTGMSAADAAAVEAMVLPDAGQQTYGALGIAVSKAVMRVDPVGAIKRRKRGEKRARVERSARARWNRSAIRTATCRPMTPSPRTRRSPS